jgi:hypothetical protein
MTTRQRRHFARTFFTLSLAAAALCFSAPSAQAVNIALDYSYDTTNYFGAGHPMGAPAGAQAKAALEAAGSFLSGILHDTLSEIETPPPFHSSQFNGVVTWNWTLKFTHPATGALQSVTNPTIAADEYRIYVGARNFAEPTLGSGGPGGYQLHPTSSGGFSSSENAQIDMIDADFVSAVQSRQEPSGFAAWGGSLAFDRLGTTWHFDHTTPVPVGANDFYSVAIHELTHALGFGLASNWNTFVDDGAFKGLTATAAHGGVAPPLAAGTSHWATGLTSEIYGTIDSQVAAMTPSITQGTRQALTKADAAALADIGWEVAMPAPNYAPADFDLDTLVNDDDLELWKLTLGLSAGADADGDNDSDGNDFLIWQRSLGNPPIVPVPEPGAMALAACGAVALVVASRRRRPRQAASSGRI